jgi:hypothetical protein
MMRRPVVLFWLSLYSAASTDLCCSGLVWWSPPPPPLLPWSKQSAATAATRWCRSRSRKGPWIRASHRQSATNNDQDYSTNGSIGTKTLSVSSSSQWCSSGTTFTADPTPVYIEDTDAYGVLYNANYVRAYERAIASVSIDSTCPPDIVAVDQMRYKIAPTLGSVYVIVGTFKDASANASTGNTALGSCATMETWDLEMRSAQNASVVYHSAVGVQIYWSPTTTATAAAHLESLHQPWSGQSRWTGTISTASTTTGSSTFLTSHSFPVYRDECLTTSMPGNACCSQLHVPLFRTMHYWERARSTILGGPDALRRLQVDHGVVVVVTGLTNVEYYPIVSSSIAMANIDESSRDSFVVEPTKTRILVETETVWKRKGTVIDCHHTAYYDNSDVAVVPNQNTDVPFGDRRLVARGCISLLALDASTKRPVRSLPEWVHEQLVASAVLL